MSEVKTEPLAATPVGDEDALFADDARPGSFVIEEDRGTLRFKLLCPCGCGAMSFLRIGRGEKPDREKAGEPTWAWDGDRERPTLRPSIHHIGHWHGWLTDGVWRSC